MSVPYNLFHFLANTAATVAGLLWFLSYTPFLFMQENYDTLSLSAKLLACLGSNSAMAFGFQVMLMYEGTGEGKVYMTASNNYNYSFLS